jgi:hypothetical protein
MLRASATIALGSVRKALRRAGLVVGVVVLACGCGGKPAPGPVSAQEPAEVGIQVDNRFAASLTIYLHSGGTSLRLGQVNIQEVQSFVVPWRRLRADGVFFLRAEVIGSSERTVTEDLRVQPGQVVRWTLAPNLGMSSVTVF